MTLRFARDMLIAGLLGLIAGLTLASLTGCTPAQQQTLGSLASNPTTVTGLRIAACVQGVLAEEERARLVERRLAEEAAELEAERIADAAREHSQGTKDAVNEVLKDGAPK
jgi:hypothetical protein